MHTYVEIIKIALLCFPLIALLITIPYMIIEYHKYGSILSFKTLIIYSFILYCLCLYFLIILPLPSKEVVASLTTSQYQLIPFYFFYDIIIHTSIQLNDPMTFLLAFKNPAIYTIILNIVMMIPMGLYLRYYFKCSLKKTMVITFLVSLFFEITQLTGLYGIYPRSYRLFDVDDLMTNTLGGLIGYQLMPLLKFLPSRDQLEALAYHKGETISFLRRLMAFMIDSALLLILTILFDNYFIGYIISVVIFMIVIPWLSKGYTIGKAIMSMKLVTTLKAPKLYQLIIRQGLLYLVILLIPYYIIWLLNNISGLGLVETLIIGCFIIFLIVVSFIFMWQIIHYIFDTKVLLMHELISKVYNQSAVKVKQSSKVYKKV